MSDQLTNNIITTSLSSNIISNYCSQNSSLSGIIWKIYTLQVSLLRIATSKLGGSVIKVMNGKRKYKLEVEEVDVLIVDTAGRLHIDDVMMQQLQRVRDAIEPDEVLFVANATTGQDAVNAAATFLGTTLAVKAGT